MSATPNASSLDGAHAAISCALALQPPLSCWYGVLALTVTGQFHSRIAMAMGSKASSLIRVVIVG
jgi:hypothetical protein